MEELEDAKTIEDCEEMATIDCHDDEESASGWLTCIEEIFAGLNNVILFGETLKLDGFTLSKNSVVAICKKGKEKIKVTLDSLKSKEFTDAQKLWLKAWSKWEKN